MQDQIKTVKSEVRPEAEYHQRQSAKAAIAREMARTVEVSDDVLIAKMDADEALSRYREVVREAARKALERY